MSAQVVCSPQGVIYNVTLGLGHNNDQGMFNYGLRDFIEAKLIKLLADRGYSHTLLVTPNDARQVNGTTSSKDAEVW